MMKHKIYITIMVIGAMVFLQSCEKNYPVYIYPDDNNNKESGSTDTTTTTIVSSKAAVQSDAKYGDTIQINLNEKKANR